MIQGLFQKDVSVKDLPFLLVKKNSNNTIVQIKMTETSKKQITGTGWEKLFVGDAGVHVESGIAIAGNENMSIDMDQRTDMTYVWKSGSIDNIRVNQWRIWVHQKSNSSEVLMKSATVQLSADNIVMLEQVSPIHTTVYAIQGDIMIKTTVWDLTLTPGNKIMITPSELANPTTDLKSFVWGIDSAIQKNQLFIKNDGQKLLRTQQKIKNDTWTGEIENTKNTETTSKYIDIISPSDGSKAKKNTISIQGKILSTEVRKVTFNEKESVVSPVNETFVFSEFVITEKVNNIVYKVYDATGNQLEKWVITIYGSTTTNVQSPKKLIPESSPISSKDFRIVSPAANPYATNKSNIRVHGTVPKDRVQYITVNGYRLQKFVPGNTVWYYFANVQYDTLREWINSYSIKFYGPNNKLLYTQLFSIIKESANAISSPQ